MIITDLCVGTIDPKIMLSFARVCFLNFYLYRNVNYLIL